MMDERAADETVRAAVRLDAFLKDDEVSDALKALSARYYSEFRAAADEESRRRAQAKANVLEDFLNELQSVIASGERVVLEAQRYQPRAPVS